jgi:hypothetical protein
MSYVSEIYTGGLYSKRPVKRPTAADIHKLMIWTFNAEVAYNLRSLHVPIPVCLRDMLTIPKWQ